MVLAPVYGSAATATAGTPGRVERTVEARYAPPYVSPVTGCHELLGPWACLIVQTRSTEAFFNAKVTDAHGQPVYFEVGAHGASVWDYEFVGGFCGQTAGPIAFRPGVSLEFDVGFRRLGIQTQCPANSIKTTGTLRVTLSNQP
jgi:hypothetical protein